MSLDIINVTIGKVETGSGETQLQTILGSCIGIGLLWQQRGLYGMAHCLLPESPTKDYSLGARYVDQAVHSLIQLMSITDTRRIRAVVAGGGNMTRQTGAKQEKLVGTLNGRSAERQLHERGIIISSQDTGGTSGRKLIIDCSTGEFDIRVIPRQEPRQP